MGLENENSDAKTNVLSVVFDVIDVLDDSDVVFDVSGVVFDVIDVSPRFGRRFGQFSDVFERRFRRFGR